MTELSSWMTRRLEELGPVRPSAFEVEGDVVEGDVVLIEQSPPGGPRQMAVVTWVDPEEQIIGVVLVSNELEQATDLDVVVTGEEARAPFDLLLEAELYGPIFTEQVVGRVGRVARPVVDALNSSISTDGESVQGYQGGPPLAGADDPRRRFKSEQLPTLRHLTRAAMSWLSGAPGDVTVLDPAMFLPPDPIAGIERGMDQGLALLDAMKTFSEQGRMLPTEFTAIFDNDEVLGEVRRWRTEFGVDVLNSLMRLPMRDVEAFDSLVGDRTWSREDVEASLQVMAELGANAGLAVLDVAIGHETDRRGAGWWLQVGSRSGRSARIREVVSA